MGGRQSISLASTSDAIVRIAKTRMERKLGHAVPIVVLLVLNDSCGASLVLVRDQNLTMHEWFRVTSKGHVQRFDADLCEPVEGRRLSTNKPLLAELALSTNFATEKHQQEMLNMCSNFIKNSSI